MLQCINLDELWVILYVLALLFCGCAMIGYLILIIGGFFL